MYDGIKLMGFVCSLFLIIGGIILLCGFSETEVELYYSTETVTNYYAIAGGFFAIFNGIFIFLLSLAVGDAAKYAKRSCENYNELKTTIDGLTSKISTENIKQVPNDKMYKKCDACGEINDVNNFFCNKCDHYLSDKTIITK